MEQKKGKTPSPFSAGYNVDSCKKAGDTPQAKKEGLNEDGNESLDKKIQTSFSEKQTAEEKYSEKDELPSESIHRRQQNISSAQSVHDTVRHQSQRSSGPSYNQLFNRLSPVYSSKTQGPLFDIKCLQQSVCRLHLPHCEIRSTGGGEFLSVAHVNDEGIEFIGPQKITETHVVINITGFSGFGNVKDEDSPADPVRALVLLFYRPPADPDAESLLNVLLLPRNVVLRDVLRTRKKLVGDESYIETSPHCKLQPKQEYTLSTCPAEDSVLVQPTEAEFDCDNYDNYFPSFQVILETMRKHVKLFLRDTNSSHSVWERRVCLTGVKRSCGPSALNLSSDKRLLDIRSSFIEGISGPVLTSLLDKLFEKTVIAEAERESADEMQNRRDKARFVIDSVRKKGEAASSEMIEFLCEADPFLCEHLGLI
ncbi:NACHT, LRR and PYD domains-containing protein 1b allele 3-like [Micropterus dolomieu]|uniref:NACHT, LRR and PYD domains-containing protein 1b allele 3-like n=1 Tax=Micropterus dolomieu TaxID=147949 RepID=UPI001E8EE17D|nr:NACHT, LRR and PYD domains-containing protein 1b allele 3-like [Micropterus dolomieu]